jgi:hypothetical protein
MVEIDYYSKYLKYKQKYLKQKSLQIGGTEIKLTIQLKGIEYKNQAFDSNKNIFEAIKVWLKNNNINIENFILKRWVKYINGGEGEEDLQNDKTFESLKFVPNKEKLIIYTK